MLNKSFNFTPEREKPSSKNDIDKALFLNTQRSFTKSCRDEEIYIKYNYLF